MEFRNLIYQQQDGLGIVVLNRPKAMNALCNDLTDELGELITVIEKDPGLQALIITGNSKVFAAGADITEMLPKDTMTSFVSMVKVHQVFDQLDNLLVPTIAAINGPCMGGGCELALCCDFRIAGEKALFALPEVSLGVIPGCGGTQRLPLVVGAAKAKEMIYLNDIVPAAKALEMGLVTKVVADDQVMDEAKAMAAKLMQKPKVALSYAKECISYGVKTDFATGKNMELSRFAMLFSTEDQKEGMTAFAEKRKPVYKNR